jgi:lysozyme
MSDRIIIDIARYQQQRGAPINWQQVVEEGHVDEVIIKFGGGIACADPFALMSWQGANAVGIKTSAYFYHISTQDVRMQIYTNACLARSIGYNPDVHGFIIGDFEYRNKLKVSKRSYTKSVFTWLLGMATEIAPPWVYTRKSFWDANVLPHGLEGKFPLVVADYRIRPAPALPRGWNFYNYWQYTERGSVPGIKGTVDLIREIPSPDNISHEIIITAWRLRIRNGPGLNHAITGHCSKGEQWQILGSIGEWLEIEPGWIHSSWTRRV